MSLTIKDWQLLGSIPPLDLAPAVAQIHHGVQFIAMVGKYFVEVQADDSHTNMEWLKEEEVLAGNWVHGKNGDFRIAMRPKDLALMIFDRQMEKVDECTLDGLTNLKACRWVEAHLDHFGEDSEKMNLLLHYEIPNHETDEGEAYRWFAPELFAEMAKYRANSDLVLRHFAGKYETASPVRTWPHHFDNGAYIPMEFDTEGNAVKSFSIGLGIPDESSDVPYFYITTWSAKGDNSYASPDSLPAGNWITEPFSGAVLSAKEITSINDTEGQLELTKAFFETGIAASLKILGL